MAGLYIHIPFCRQACHYCDFHFSTNLERKAELAEALCREMIMQQPYLGHETLNTIYFGGGTPSILSGEEFALLMRTIRSAYAVHHDAEITVEANPDDLAGAQLRMLKENGVNRLSIGIQSFNDTVLKFLNRSHNARLATACVHEARAAGFSNISIDIMYAVPGESLAGLQETIDRALQLDPGHISAYSLTIEEKTAFGRWSARGRLAPVPDDQAAAQMELLMKKLEEAGYEHYEVSNFSKPGFHSRHNSSYWGGEKYLGIGPGAHSFNGYSRQYNVSNNNLYIRAVQEGQVPCETETLSQTDKINEYLLTSLRTRRGCDVQKLKNELDFDILFQRATYLDELFSKKMALLDEGMLKLTRTGLLFADKIAADLFEENPAG